jgi:YHS domain-containing protein|tara:strand:- start:371 stop:520 length:150 start_codon:yes stop_codon:yes gene_type:complete
MKVSYTAAVEEFAYQGKAYYFCSSACREAFEFNPVQYLPRHRQHGIKTR